MIQFSLYSMSHVINSRSWLDRRMVSVDLHDDKAEVLRARASEKGYETLEEYVDYLMGQIVDKIRREKQDIEGYSDEEEQKVKDRLRDLGYMN